MGLKSIRGQQRAVGILFGILRNGKIANSYLFSGENGIGKKTAALAFAKALNCSDPGPDGDCCGLCDSCTKIDAGVHPDFLFIAPEEKQIRIEEIRAVEDALSFKAYEGSKKIVLVDDAEAMNASAANAFLKTLEEPPADCVLILVSSRPDLFPSTIVSRCSEIRFTPLPLEDCREVLRGRVPEEHLESLSRLAMGRPGLALSGDFIENKTWFVDLFKGMLQAEKDGWASREDMDRWFEYALVFFRDLAVLKITGKQASLINQDLGDYLTGISKSLDLKGIIEVHKDLNSLKDKLIFNLNKGVTWNYTASLLRKEFSVRNG